MPATDTSAPPQQHHLGRLVLLAIVLIAAAAAFGLSHHARKPDAADWLGVQMNGATSQHQPIFAVERRDAVRAFYMNWRVACPSGATYIVGGHFREPLSYFHRNRLAFTLDLRRPAADGGRRGRAHATVGGRLSADLRTAEGIAQRTIVWHGGGKPVEVCSSGRVSWRATLAPGSKPN